MLVGSARSNMSSVEITPTRVPFLATTGSRRTFPSFIVYKVQNAQTIISEVGVDMSRWKTEKHFASWLGLCPDNRISGDKVLKRSTRHVVNRASTALRLAASALLRSQSALGAKFRRLRSKLGAPKAITAMAHMLARLVYRMLKFGHDYVDRGVEFYEASVANRCRELICTSWSQSVLILMCFRIAAHFRRFIFCLMRDNSRLYLGLPKCHSMAPLNSTAE